VTVGAAAPVIALAAIVSVTDVMGSREVLGYSINSASLTARQIAKISDLDQRASIQQRSAFFVGIINGGLQLVALSMAFESLAVGHDVVPLVFPRIAVPLGLFLVLLSSTIAVSLRRTYRQIRAAVLPAGAA
jgi:hypothetical protein